eukprot:CAMPEP_0181525788 /NCGR_PEP_ID=MMETSP1110-20121109/69147_1 /TAXON_ID=174948 /ORGANISM="Symbiodinium sp., Strain CCMP421" /LENGTH=73 /DNA_ID=CAMNT_0023656601 /DNA_START=393 /DNA_END=614 /DNA_ORIENTATION=-
MQPPVVFASHATPNVAQAKGNSDDLLPRLAIMLLRIIRHRGAFEELHHEGIKVRIRVLVDLCEFLAQKVWTMV